MAAADGVAESKSLIEIDHQIDVCSDAFPYGSDRCEIIPQMLVAETKLHGCEATFFGKSSCLACESRDFMPPQAVAVVGSDRANGAAEQDCERQVRLLRQSIPESHVERGGGDCRYAGQADDVQRLECSFEHTRRCNRFANQSRTQVSQHSDHCGDGGGSVGSDIGVPCDPAARLDVHEHEGPLVEPADPGDHGASEGNQHRSNVDRADRGLRLRVGCWFRRVLDWLGHDPELRIFADALISGAAARVSLAGRRERLPALRPIVR